MFFAMSTDGHILSGKVEGSERIEMLLLGTLIVLGISLPLLNLVYKSRSLKAF